MISIDPYYSNLQPKDNEALVLLDHTCMHFWQSFSPCLINWIIQSATLYTDNANLQQTGMNLSACIQLDESSIDLYDGHNFEAINFVFYTYYYSNISSKIAYFLSSSKLICPSMYMFITLPRNTYVVWKSYACVRQTWFMMN